MHSENLGTYIDKATGAKYEVLKRTTAVSHASIDKPVSKLAGAVDYVTKCGKDLNPMAEDDSVFEIFSTGSLIHRQ